jgi:hypothetical protein
MSVLDDPRKLKALAHEAMESAKQAAGLCWQRSGEPLFRPCRTWSPPKR